MESASESTFGGKRCMSLRHKNGKKTLRRTGVDGGKL